MVRPARQLLTLATRSGLIQRTPVCTSTEVSPTATNAHYDEAIADYTKAIRLHQHDAEAYFGRALAYRDKGDYTNSVADFTMVIRLKPSDAGTYACRGFVYARKGDYDKRQPTCNEAIRLDPQDADAFCNRGIAYGNKGERDKAIADYSEATASAAVPTAISSWPGDRNQNGA